MPWYSYLFFVLFAIVLLIGIPANARAKNTAGVIAGLAVALTWLGLGLWTGGFLS